LKADGLVVKEAVVGEGPTFKRMTPRARGSGSRILKRTSHIRIVLTDDVVIETRATKKAKRDQEKKASEGGEKSTAAKKGKKKTAKAAKK
jgi:large subunit ribosomal protein L22